MKITELTPEQEALIPVVRDEYVNAILECKPTDEDVVREMIPHIYRIAGFEPPKEIIIVDSPLAVQNKARELTGTNEFFSTTLNFADSWVAFYDYFERIGLEYVDDWKYVRDYVRARPFWTTTLDGAAIISRMPVEIHVDEENRYHNMSGPSVKFADGFSMWHFHGLSVTQQIIEAPETITKRQYLGETNAEMRRAMVQCMGADNHVKLLDMKVIDEDESRNQIYKLWRTKKEDEVAGAHLQFVEVVCPSSDRHYFLGVRPDIATAREAVASTFPDLGFEYDPLVET